jgi:hypothetical protein
MIFVPHRKHVPPLPVTAIALNFICICWSYLTGNTSLCLHGLLGLVLPFIYVDDVRTSQEARASTACYGDSFKLYMYMLIVPDRKHLCASTACYGDSFASLYVDDVRTSQEALASTYSLRCYFYLYYVYYVLPHKKPIHWPLRPITEIHFYAIADNRRALL